YSSFNRNGYASIQPFEDTHFPSPYIHTPDDILGLSVNNMDQVKRFTELNLGLVATLAGLVSDGLDENPDEAVMVYPNPASDIVTVKGMPVQEIHVYNRLGQRLLSRSFDNTEACTFDVSALTPDLYLVQVVGPQQVKAVKLTIDN
nr:T9SS type A sorting domain-containing protein [Bacteroidales bacterium]